MIKKLVVALLSAFAVASAYGQGIPVYDNLAQLQFVQQLATAAQQLEQLRAGLTQMKQQYDSLNGLRDVANLLKNKLLQQYLTPDQRALLDALRSGNVSGTLSGISGTLKEIQKKNALISCQKASSSPAVQASCEKAWNQAALAQHAGSEGYAQAAENINDLQDFLNKIKNSPDPKSLQDLQARISIEQLKQQNEASKLAMFKVMQDAQDRMDRMNASAATQQMLKTGEGIRF